MRESTEAKNKKKSEDIDTARRSPLRDLPEWLEEFADNVVDEEASVSSEAPASISPGPHHQEPSRKVVSGKHRIFTHFPKDRNCEACNRTESVDGDRNLAEPWTGFTQVTETSRSDCFWPEKWSGMAKEKLAVGNA